jgi:hypothetical protein
LVENQVSLAAEIIQEPLLIWRKDISI